MHTAAYQSSRPLAVNLALILLLINTGTGFIEQLLDTDWQSADWSNPLHYIKWGSMVLMLLVPLWGIFRRKNWARWILVVLAVTGFCVSLPTLLQYFQAHSFSWVVSSMQRTLIDTVTLVLLFLPVSSQWFRGHTNANAA